MSYRIGIDNGGTNIKTGVIDENDRIVAFDLRRTQAFERSFEAVVADMAAAAAAVAAKVGLSLTDFPCLGVGTPGSVQCSTGTVVHAGNFNWDRKPLRAELQKYLPIPVHIGNDANCAAAGEVIAGAARDKRNVLLFTLGTGLGGGVIINGKIFEGGDGLGAELGHTPLVFEGVPCTCGIEGCLESYASVTGLIRQTREAMEAHPTSMMCTLAEERGVVNGRTAFDCARQGDAAALSVVDRYTSYVAAGIGGMVTTFRPELVLIGGAISNEGDFLLDPIEQKLPKYVFGSAYCSVPPVKRAALGNDAGIIGAAYLDVM